MAIAAPQSLEIWFHGDTTVTVTMSPPVDVTGWTLDFVIFDGDSAVMTKSVTKANAVAGVFTTTLAPNLDGPAATPPVTLEPGRVYGYAFRRTDAGARDPGLAYGPLRFKLR